MKKPFLYASGAALYIVLIVSIVNATSGMMPRETIIIPMTMLSLFVLSAAVMGFLFLSEAFQLYLDGHKKEAVAFFGKIVGFFTCYVVLFAILILLS